MPFGINHVLDSLKTLGSDRVLLFGGFFTNGASDPATISGDWIASVTHTATGKYTLTFKDAITSLAAKFPDLSMSTPDGSYADAGPFTAATATTAATLKLETRNAGGTLADIAAATDNYVSIACFVKNTGVARPT